MSQLIHVLSPRSPQDGHPQYGSPRNDGTRFAIPALLWLGLLTLGVLAAGAGITDAGPGRPPVVILAFVLGPPVLFLIACRVSAAVRAWVAGLDLTAVTLAQSWRVGGVLFLPLAWWGHLSWAFALPAGLGDVAVGLLAPFVALAVERRSEHWRQASYGLIGLGLVDFVAAVGMGAAVSAGVLASLGAAEPEPAIAVLPLSLIPTVLVPTWLILHLIAWLRVREAR